jgi:5S rRNA maturation endonuclease (ribonuclease M5)
MSSIPQAKNGAQPQAPDAYTTSVEELAQAHGFKRIGNEWHGANPKGGATDDGYILNDDGSSFDRKLNQRFTSIETAQNFNIAPDEYEPVAYYQKQNGSAPNFNRTTPKPTKASGTNAAKPKSKPISQTFYDYTKDGTLLYQAVRREYSDRDKDFTQRRPDGRGQWIYDLKGVTTVLYNSDDVKAAQDVIVCEGEKAADELNAWLKSGDVYGESVATTNPMGADMWRDHLSDELTGKDVFVLPDNDEPGRRHAAKIAQSLTGKAASIKVVELSGLPEKGDVVEYFANGKTLENLLAEIVAAPEYAPPKARFALVSILELLQRPDPTWLIHGVLQSNTNSCLSAAHASFKSFLALDMALSVATGRRWCERDVIQGNVVYVCAEGASGMKARVLAWCNDKQIDPPTNFHFIDDAVQVHEPKDRADFFKSLGELKPALIIFDTLSLCALGLEENASKDMNLFMDSVKRVQIETGAHVLLIHHHSKAGGSRGSSAIPAAVQSEFELKRERDGATLTCTKQKDGAEFKPLSFKSRLVEYDTWKRKSSLVLDYEGDSENADALTGNDTRVYELLVETFGIRGATASNWWAIADGEKIARRSFYRALKNLVEKGKVDDGKDGKGGRGATYRPTELLEAEAEKVSANEKVSAKPDLAPKNHENAEVSAKHDLAPNHENAEFSTEFTSESPEKVSAKVTMAPTGTNGTNATKRVSAKVPTPFRVGTNGTNLCAEEKPARKSRKKAAEVTP